MKTPDRFRSFLLLTLFVFPAVVYAEEKSNVLLILVDDLKPALGCYGDEWAITPGIDKLASRAMRFNLAYCNQAVCAPSRFNLMLGSLSTSTGLYGLGINLRDRYPEAVTMPQHFKKHGGHKTISIGKIFHVGHGNLGDPTSFDVVHKDKVVEYLLPESRDTEISKEEVFFELSDLSREEREEFLKDKTVGKGAAIEIADVADDAYADGRTAAKAVEYLQGFKESGEPFFLCAGFARPHLPFSAPKKYFDMHPVEKFHLPEVRTAPNGSPPYALRHKRGEVFNYFPCEERFDEEEFQLELIRAYYASTSYVSAQIGKVVDALIETGLDENTYVVLWGDHGWHLGTHNRFSKHDNFEQPTRIPLLIAGPGIEPETSTKQLTATIDIFPTLADLAGLPAPAGPQPIDGLSLRPVLDDPEARIRDHITHCFPKQKFGWAIRTERYRLVQWGDPAKKGGHVYELYDFEKEPIEKNNVAARNPEIVAEMKKKLALYPTPLARK
ncbi:MAG: sulfatase [Verrucomicrobiota bacterium]